MTMTEVKTSHYNPPPHSIHSSASMSHPPPQPLQRVQTLDLKAKLAAALGSNGKQYWNALVQFCTAKISRDEFESEARSCLRSEDVHLHNALVLGILYNASSAVPGPSSSRGVLGTLNGSQNESSSARNATNENAEEDTEDLDAELDASLPPGKRLRLLAASLSTKERQRIKAVGKPPARNFASGANASSWAGAGADLLEKKRKEEEKKQKEIDRRRLREVHTQISANDWAKDALAEDAIRQENRTKLPNGTLQALMRSSKVPLCTDAKVLPGADSLADMMTSQAVEVGLSGGVTVEASTLLLAGLQAHLQNLASGMIMAVRANRASGGIQTSSIQPTSASADSADESFSSNQSRSDGSLVDSPVAGSAEMLPPDAQSNSGYPNFLHIDTGRPRPSDISSSTSTSSRSASTVASSIFTTASAHRHNSHAGVGPDTSVTSLASTSTAPTSHTRGNSETGSQDGDDVMMDSEDLKAKEKMRDAVNGKDHLVADEERAHGSKLAVRAIPLDHRPFLKRGHAAANSEYSPLPPSQPNKIGLRDVAFLFELSPHVTVEPVGVAAMERLLAPEHDTLDDEGDEFQDENRPTSSKDSLLPSFDEEERLALAARWSAFSKHSSFEASQHDRHRLLAPLPSGTAARRGRQDYIINQQGPWSLLLKRPLLTEREQASEAEALAAAEANKTATEVKTTQGKRARAAQDPLSDVVDPVKLLAGLCD